MKKIFLTLFAAIFLLSFSVPAFAANGNTYQLDEPDMTIEIPSDYIVFWRDMPADDPNLAAYNLTKEEVESLMGEDIYLDSWDKDFNVNISITVADNFLGDFNQYNSTALDTIASSIVSGIADRGTATSDYTIYQHEQAKFIKFYFQEDTSENTLYGLRYCTSYNKKTILIDLMSFLTEIDPSMESLLQGIVDSIHFGTDPVKTPVPEETDPFVYSDKDTNVEFTVPANWVQGEFIEEREFWSAKFKSNLDPILSILYGTIDLWEQLPVSERLGRSRQNYNNASMTDADLAEMAGIDAGQITKKILGEKEYFSWEVTSSAETYGLSTDVTTSYLLTIENGYAYMFQFSGNSSDAYYEDFESLVSSAKYPSVPQYDGNNAEDVGSAYDTDEKDTTPNLFIASLFFSLLITIAVYSLPIIIYRYLIRKKPMEPKAAKKVTVIYAVIAFLLMSVLIFLMQGNGAAGGAILFWSWINYLILTKGEDRTKAAIYGGAPPTEFRTPQPDSPETMSVPKAEIPTSAIPQTEPVDGLENNVNFCHKCGAKLSRQSEFCHKCGTKVIRPTDSSGEVPKG